MGVDIVDVYDELAAGVAAHRAPEALDPRVLVVDLGLGGAGRGPVGGVLRVEQGVAVHEGGRAGRDPVDGAAERVEGDAAGRAAGVGAPLSEPIVRGAMLLRLTGFLGGYAAVSPALCSFIADRLNDGWFPLVPAGVTGAAGEIVPLAHLFRTFAGEGLVHGQAGPTPALQALAARGVAPYRLGAKDHDKYAAIGESDRFTLRFVKPAK